MSTLESRVLRKPTVRFAIGSVMDVGFGTLMTLHGSRKAGDSLPVTVAKVGMDALTGSMLGPIGGLAYGAASVGFEVMMQQARENGELQKKMTNVGSGRIGSGYFNMSNAGYTMRQRALNQIRSNGQMIDSVFGNEARNYISSANVW